MYYHYIFWKTVNHILNRNYQSGIFFHKSEKKHFREEVQYLDMRQK